MDYKQRLKAQLELVRGTTESILSAFKTPQDWTYQVHPQANHALWVAGHLTVADNMMVSKLAPEKAATLPPAYKEMFSPGSKPSPDPNDYPPPEDVLARMRERRAALLAAARWTERGRLVETGAERRSRLYQRPRQCLRVRRLPRGDASRPSHDRPTRSRPPAALRRTRELIEGKIHRLHRDAQMKG